MTKAVLFYDIEIKQAVPKRGEERVPGITYCESFDDHANMDVACICAYDTETGRYRVFTSGTFGEFEALAAERIVVGFNSIKFDDSVCGQSNIHVRTEWDLLQEIWVAVGLGRTFKYPTHAGYGLDATAKANGLTGKTGWGGSAPIDWQKARFGKVIDYCLEDVRLLRRLVERACKKGGGIRHPKSEDYGLLALDVSKITGGPAL